MKFWEEKLETSGRIDLQNLQLVRLKTTITQAMQAPFYAALYASLGINENSVKSVRDIEQLPFTTKEDLRANFPDGFLSVTKRQVVRLHS